MRINRKVFCYNDVPFRNLPVIPCLWPDKESAIHKNVFALALHGLHAMKCYIFYTFKSIDVHYLWIWIENLSLLHDLSQMHKKRYFSILVPVSRCLHFICSGLANGEFRPVMQLAKKIQLQFILNQNRSFVILYSSLRIFWKWFGERTGRDTVHPPHTPPTPLLLVIWLQ